MNISLTQSSLGFPVGFSCYPSLNHSDSPTASDLWSRVPRFTAACKVKWTQRERKGRWVYLWVVNAGRERKSRQAGSTFWSRVMGLPFKKTRLRLKNQEFLHSLESVHQGIHVLRRSFETVAFLAPCKQYPGCLVPAVTNTRTWPGVSVVLPVPSTAAFQPWRERVLVG